MCINMKDLFYASLFVLTMLFFSIVMSAFDKDVKQCEIINEMVKYCYNDKGERVRV